LLFQFMTFLPPLSFLPGPIFSQAGSIPLKRQPGQVVPEVGNGILDRFERQPQRVVETG
jgi:hypothetical protein